METELYKATNIVRTYTKTGVGLPPACLRGLNGAVQFLACVAMCLLEELGC